MNVRTLGLMLRNPEATWEVVFETIGSLGLIGRTGLLRRFRYEEDVSLHAIIRDLLESGLVIETRGGRRVRGRAAPVFVDCAQTA